jgi:hypothetical protein
MNDPMNEPMYCTMVNEYADGELRPDERDAFEEHLIRCAGCQDELERLLGLQYQLLALPKIIQPGRDLWPQIESSIRTAADEPALVAQGRGKNGRGGAGERSGRPRVRSWYLRAAAAVGVLIAGGAVWFALRQVEAPAVAVGPAAGIATRSAAGGLPPAVKAPNPPEASGARASVAPASSPDNARGTHAARAERPAGEGALADREMDLLEERLRRGSLLPAAALLPTSSGKIVGIVSDERGKPVDGINVEIVNLGRSALTDAKGKFEFFGLTPDAYTLQVRGIGYEQNTVNSVKIIPGFTAQVNFHLRTGSDALTNIAMSKEQLFAEVENSASLDEIPMATYARPSVLSNRLKVEGKVIDERGRSIVGAIVLVLGTKRGAYSDNEGKFHIYGVPPGSYTLQATASGYAERDTASVQVYSDFPVTVDIALDAEEGR